MSQSTRAEPAADVSVPAFRARLVERDVSHEPSLVHTWELRYTRADSWEMVEVAVTASDGSPAPFQRAAMLRRMDGDHYVEVERGVYDMRGVPEEIRKQYEPTFWSLSDEERRALIQEGVRRGYVKVIDIPRGEATGTDPVPPTQLFEVVTPYPWNFGGSPALSRHETMGPDGTRVVTLTGRLTCLQARVRADLCGSAPGAFETVAKPVVRTYELRPDGIPVRFTETFGGATTKVITLEDVTLS